MEKMYEGFCSLLVRRDVHRMLIASGDSSTGTAAQVQRAFINYPNSLIRAGQINQEQRGHLALPYRPASIIKLMIKGIKICTIIFLKATIEEEVYCQMPLCVYLINMHLR